MIQNIPSVKQAGLFNFEALFMLYVSNAETWEKQKDGWSKGMCAKVCHKHSPIGKWKMCAI